ncbi:hypothetical protein ALC62_14512 [Cyphomyrmex costatus]|uniref:Uncharacterized protein n=1 Tax=Cyphomyrmex costatus TaxID=456900 RepID=A0A195C266_9HYME|nr:hypothetical protein ALC62_14512 [Cyphomyrmex costatus]
MIVTASKIPVPEPIAPKKSASTERAPIHSPPNAAAVGMYRFNSRIMELSLWPRITICCSLSYLNHFLEKIILTSFAELPETSIHVLEKKAHEPSMKRM